MNNNQTADEDDARAQSDAIWVLSSTFIIFTMQSGTYTIVLHCFLVRPYHSLIMQNGSESDNSTQIILSVYEDPQADSIWILTSTFIIFAMQSGFGLLESGSVSIKNEVNIMVKNAVDVIFGGLTFWMFGYGFSFGENKAYSNAFCGWGQFFVSASEEELGWVYSKFFFQASFATTATTIVSGSMAERTKLESYIVFSMINTFIFCFPAHWVWASNGWLRLMGVVDIAGAGPVHLVGGVTGLVATILLKPRHKRFSTKYQPAMGSPTNAILGMFMLWWGWLGFNCGSTFGISGSKWKLAARSAVSTITASVSGGIVGLSLSYIFKNRRFDVSYLINGVLGSLVGITATCALAQPWEGLVIGFIGALITNASCELLNKLKIDDPVGCVGTHACAGIWSLISAGLLTKMDSLAMEIQLDNVKGGLVYTGDFRQLGVQTLAAVVIIIWTTVTSFISLKLIDLIIGIRVPKEEEILGADIVEHAIGGYIYSKKEKKVIFYPDDGIQPSDEENEESQDRNSRQRRHSLGLRLRTGSRSLIAKENRLVENKRKLIGCWKRRRKSATITTVQDLVNHVVKRNSISPCSDRRNAESIQNGGTQIHQSSPDSGFSNPNYVHTEEKDAKSNGNAGVNSDLHCKSLLSLDSDDKCRDNSLVTYL